MFHRRLSHSRELPQVDCFSSSTIPTRIIVFRLYSYSRFYLVCPCAIFDSVKSMSTFAHSRKKRNTVSKTVNRDDFGFKHNDNVELERNMRWKKWRKEETAKNWKNISKKHLMCPNFSKIVINENNNNSRVCVNNKCYNNINYISLNENSGVFFLFFFCPFFLPY